MRAVPQVLILLCSLSMLFAPSRAAAQISCGDCNSDATVSTILDALVSARIAAGLVLATTDQACACDVDSNGFVNILDALLMAQAAAGLPATLACPMTPCGNSPPLVAIVSPTSGTERGRLTVIFDTADPDLDLLDLVVEWSSGGSPFALASSAGTGSIATNPAPATAPALAQTFVWDSVADGVGLVAPAGVDLRITATDPATASGADQVSFTVDNTVPPAPTTWTRLFPATVPLPRYGHEMAYDSNRQVTVMFGGNSNSGFLAETWEWDGTNWTQRFPPSSPGARYRFGMAFDPVRNVTVLFGGDSLNNETWEWNGTTWANISPVGSPSARSQVRLAYDEAAARIVLFGGGSYLNDTWTYNGTTWTQLSTPVRPAQRSMVGLEYDPGSSSTMLFGGYDGGTFNDTWFLSGSTWTQAAPAASPPTIWAHSMSYDSLRQVMVLFGGATQGSVTWAINETWEWNGTTWTRFFPATAPAPRIYQAQVYDAARGHHFLFAGAYAGGMWDNECWIY